MDAFINFLKDFGGIISTAFLLSVLGIAFQMFRSTIDKKDVQLEILREQNRVLQTFSVENVVDKFRALKEYYESQQKEWYEASIKTLEKEKDKALAIQGGEFRSQIEHEIEQREQLIKTLPDQTNGFSLPSLRLSIEQVVGTYTVTGHNPHSPDITYFGELTISDETQGTKALIAEWFIGVHRRRHLGVGILLGNVLAVHFKLRDVTGIVLYEFISSDVMRGYWTSLDEPERRIGYEECRKTA